MAAVSAVGSIFERITPSEVEQKERVPVFVSTGVATATNSLQR